jgi:glyoxylase I family protein
MTAVHHAAICTHDIQASLRFWRDSLGFEVQMDERFTGDWPTLFHAPSNRLRSIFLGDADNRDTGIIELVDFGGDLPEEPVVDGPARGFFLLSLFVDLDRVLAALTANGFEAPLREIEVYGGVRMAVVRDPNGVLLELIGR